MASYHILKSRLSGTSLITTVEYHIPVPVENNTVNGISNYLQTSLKNDDEVVKVSGDPNIANAEAVNITQGEVYLVLDQIILHKDQLYAVRQQKIRDRYADLVVSAIEELRSIYQFQSITEQEGVDF